MGLLFPETSSLLEAAVQSGVAPGFVFGVWRSQDPDTFSIEAFGNRALEPTRLPMERETVFDLASLTKVLATATAIAQLKDRGWLNWNTPAAEIWDGVKSKKIQIRHLLSHTAGYKPVVPLFQTLAESFSTQELFRIPVDVRQRKARELISQMYPEHAPEEVCAYSDIGHWVLGFIIEELWNAPFDEAIQRELWNPMGVEGLHFHRIRNSPAREVRLEVAATERSDWRGGILQGQVHDDNAWAMGGFAGHAGAFGRAIDVLLFSRKLLSGFISQKTLIEMWRKVPAPAGCTRTLGWDTPSEVGSSAGELFSKFTVGHLGYTGTSLWIDLEKGLVVTLLSNRVHPTRTNEKIRELRPKFHNAIHCDLQKTGGK